MNILKKIDNIFEHDQKSELIGLICAYGFSLIFSYSLVFNKLLLNIDTMKRMDGYTSMGGANVGRIFRNLVGNGLSFGEYNPQVTTLWFAVFLFLAIWYIYKLFEIKKYSTKLLVMFTVVTFPLFGIFYMYGNDVFLHSLCAFLATLSIYYLFSDKRFKYIKSAAALIFMLGIYQAFLSVVASLFFAKIIVDILEHKEPKIVDLAVKFLVLVAAAMVYYIIFKLILASGLVEPTFYKGADSLGVKSIILFIPQYIVLSYRYFIQLLLGNINLFATEAKISIVYCFAGLSYVITFVKIWSAKYSISDRIIMSSLILLMPLALFAASLATGFFDEYSQYGLMIFFVTSVLLWSYIDVKFDTIKFVGIAALIVFNFHILSSYLLIDSLNTDQFISYEYKIIYDLQSDPRIEKTDKVAFCGDPFYHNSNIDYARDTDIYKYQNRALQAGSSILYSNGTKQQIDMTNLLGYNFNINAVDCSKVAKGNPMYPMDGYIREISDDQYVVKLGENFSNYKYFPVEDLSGDEK